MGDRPAVTEAINQARFAGVVFAACAFAILAENRAMVVSSRIMIGEGVSLLLGFRDREGTPWRSFEEFKQPRVSGVCWRFTGGSHGFS
jgi:hypothetical protein